MGTSNFYYRNTSKVYAIGLSHESAILDEDGNETDEMEIVSCDEWEVDEIFDNIKYELEQNKGKFSFSDYKRQSANDNRNFPASFLGSLSTSKYFGDVNVDVQLNCFCRAGYYDGGCLDWELELTIGDYDTDDLIDAADTFFECCYSNNMNKGMLKIQSKNVLKWATNIKKQLVDVIEKVFENSSRCMVTVATFSNGETIYADCN